MTLTTVQRNQRSWLRTAYRAGYDEGFKARPNRYLETLERLLLIERNPTSTGKHTLWRITDLGWETHRRFGL